MDLGPQELHPVDVQGLSLHIMGPHEDLALQSEVRGEGRRGNTVLSRTGLRDHPGLAHPLRQEALADDVVDLMGAGVVQVLPLEVHLGTPKVPGHPVGVVEHRRPSGVLPVELVDLPQEVGVLDVSVIGLVQLYHRVHQRLRDVLPPVLSVNAAISGHVCQG